MQQVEPVWTIRQMCAIGIPHGREQNDHESCGLEFSPVRRGFPRRVGEFSTECGCQVRRVVWGFANAWGKPPLPLTVLAPAPPTRPPEAHWLIRPSCHGRPALGRAVPSTGVARSGRFDARGDGVA
jgi:hypothetical protein